MREGRVLVTGGAGFIGSHVVDRLMEKGYEVIVLDNLSAGDISFLNEHLSDRKFEFHNTDLLHEDLSRFFEHVHTVWHLAANPEVRVGAEDTRIHLEQNIIVTHRVLEAMRECDVPLMVFTSTSTVYGEALRIPTPEDYGPLMPISLYGASKLACEAMISAYCHTFGMKAVIYRFANVVGRRSRHGVIYDFIMKLSRNPHELEILGDGTQTKSYIYVDDCVDAMFFGLNAIENMKHECNSSDSSDSSDEPDEEGVAKVFNIGTEDTVSVRRIAEIVSEELGLNPKFKFTGGRRGWKGDVPVMLLDSSELRALGWRPRLNAEEAVRMATRDLIAELNFTQNTLR
ncbi:UDP-glucose 4-epimerase, partial [Methanosarcinales archaeon]